MYEIASAATSAFASQLFGDSLKSLFRLQNVLALRMRLLRFSGPRNDVWKKFDKYSCDGYINGSGELLPLKEALKKR